MGIVLAFAVGYFVGANAGQDGYRDVVDSLRAVRESEELHALLAAVRAHAGATFHQLGGLLEEGPAESFNPAHLLERVRDLVDRASGDRGGDG